MPSNLRFTSSDVTAKPSASEAEARNGRPSTPGQAHPEPSTSSPLQSPKSPFANLKSRLSLFASSRHDDNDDAHSESNSEDELLIDPNLPADYHQRHQTLPRHSLSTHDHDHDDEAAIPLAPRPGNRKPSTSSISLSDDEEEDQLEIEDSPYPEVRAAVRPYDDYTLPCNTLRAWTIGLSLIFLGASMNTLFSLRAPSISLGSLIAQVIAWPLGHGWARVVPDRELFIPLPSFVRSGGRPTRGRVRERRAGAGGEERIGWRLRLNPGPFNVKEHSIIVVMASVSFSVAYATDIILAQKVFYKQDFGFVWQLMLVVSTQSLGYGIAGMMRRFLGMVCPSSSSSAVAADRLGR